MPFHSAPSKYVSVLQSGKQRAWERFLIAFNCGKRSLGDNIPASARPDVSSRLQVVGEGLHALVGDTVDENGASGMLASVGADSFERALRLWTCHRSSLALSGAESV